MTTDESEEMPLPVVVEIKPVNQFADKLFEMVTAPASERFWDAPQQHKKVVLEKGVKTK